MLQSSLLPVLAIGFTSLLTATHAQHCPEPSSLKLTNKEHDEATFRWDDKRHISERVYCVCNSEGDIVQYTCSEQYPDPNGCNNHFRGYSARWTGLTRYTNYTFCVQTRCGTGDYSTPTCRQYKTPPLAPSEPHTLFVDAHSTSSLDVSWRLPIYYNGPLDGYRVSWCEAGNCAFNFAFLKGADRRSYRITGLNAYTKYRVKVNAYNMDRGEYLFSSYEDMNVFTLATAPSNPTITVSHGSFQAMEISPVAPKHPNGPISGYKAWWCVTRRCYGSNARSSDIETSTTTEEVTNLRAWTDYTFSLKAYNTMADGTRMYSGMDNVTANTMPFSTAAPPNFQARATSPSTIHLTWDVPPNAEPEPSRYRVTVCTLDKLYCLEKYTGKKYEHTMDHLVPWTPYSFTVVSLINIRHDDLYVVSQPSSTTGVTWPGAPGRPDSLQVSKSGATSLEVSWQKPLDPVGHIDGYKARICPEKGACHSTHVVSRYKWLSNSTMSHWFYGLQPYTSYNVEIRAFNLLPDGDTADGDMAVLDAKTAPTYETDLEELHADAVNNTALEVAWLKHADNKTIDEAYRITWWKSGGSSTDDPEDQLANETALLQGDVTDFVIAGLDPYTVYIIQVDKVTGEAKANSGGPARTEGRPDPRPLPKPVGLTAETSNVEPASSNVVVRWNSPYGFFDPPIRGFLVRLCPFEGDEDDVPESSNCRKGNTTDKVLTFEWEDLQRFADYVITVRGYTMNGDRVVEGEVAKVRIATDPPSIPEVAELKVNVTDWNHAVVSWEKGENLDNFIVEYKVSLERSHDGKVIEERRVSETEATLDGLRAVLEYRVEVSTCVVRTGRSFCGAHAATEFSTSEES